MSPCNKKCYSEPTRAVSQEGTSTRAEKSGVTHYLIMIGWRLGWRITRFWLPDEFEGFFRARFWLADEIWGCFLLNSDWLPTMRRFWAQTGCVRQCTKRGSGLILPTVRLFRKKKLELFFSCRPARADNFYGADQLRRLRTIITSADLLWQNAMWKDTSAMY